MKAFLCALLVSTAIAAEPSTKPRAACENKMMQKLASLPATQQIVTLPFRLNRGPSTPKSGPGSLQVLVDDLEPAQITTRAADGTTKSIHVWVKSEFGKHAVTVDLRDGSGASKHTFSLDTSNEKSVRSLSSDKVGTLEFPSGAKVHTAEALRTASPNMRPGCSCGVGCSGTLGCCVCSSLCCFCCNSGCGSGCCTNCVD